MTTILWLRRDLRRGHHPALTAAVAGDQRVLPLFVIDPALWDTCGPVRRGWLAATLRATDSAYDGRLCLRIGDPADVLPRLVREVGASAVHVTGESTPWGARRDRRARDVLRRQGIGWVATGTPYAVTPGTVRNQSGAPYQVFGAFARAWRLALTAPADTLADGWHHWAEAASDPAATTMLDHAIDHCPVALPEAGEHAAERRWRTFLRDRLDGYAGNRDRPDLAGTSQLSPWLKVGAIHPAQLLADLPEGGGPDIERLVDELVWREFYADVLHHNPHSAWHDLRPALRSLAYDDSSDALTAWQTGHTGYPIVDAGMRQLAATGWMHNRIRMLTASFLTKDLHVWWPADARFFLQQLLDADIASNNQGWQWVAGTGTDPAPYFRVFNPVTQAKRFDPQGDYVRRWIPELAHLGGPQVHEPWRVADGYAHGYPERIVDHAVERREALARYDAARRSTNPPRQQ